eukprot:353182-Chlamydomonas_euryale.AAC.12
MQFLEGPACMSHPQQELLKRHRAGDLLVLTNVAMLTEGYDDTSVSCNCMILAQHNVPAA